MGLLENMKAVQIEKPWEINIVDIPEPERKGNAIIRIKAAGICGSDMGAFRGTNNLVTYPRIIGHELAGEIVYLPAGYTGSLQIGDRVVTDPYIGCGECYPCKIGRRNCCENLRVLGVHIDGGMTEYFAHPADMLVPIPDGLSWQEAAMAEPLTIALHSIHRLQLKEKEHVLVFGAGPIGLLVAMVAKAYNCVPILIDPVQGRLDYANKLGYSCLINPQVDDMGAKIYEYCGYHTVEAVVEASGSNSAIESTLEYVSNAGRIVFTGWPKNKTLLATDVFTRKELDVRGARNSLMEFPEALNLIKQGLVPVLSLVSEVIEIDEVPRIMMDMDINPGNYMKSIVLIR